MQSSTEDRDLFNVALYPAEDLWTLIGLSNESDRTWLNMRRRIEGLMTHYRAQNRMVAVSFFEQVFHRLEAELQASTEPPSEQEEEEEEEGQEQEGSQTMLPPTDASDNTAANVHAVPVQKDALNPLLKNTITRLINLDSQFRQASGGDGSDATDYTLDLSETLRNTLQLSLYSYQIPFGWYVIDEAYGNHCCWVVRMHPDEGNAVIPILVPSGNYTYTEFEQQLTRSFESAGLQGATATYQRTTGKLTLSLYGARYTGVPSFVCDDSEEVYVVFFDFTGTLTVPIVGRNRGNHCFNNTLGWIMGFRTPYQRVTPEGMRGSAMVDLNGTKYLILAIDDFNQNHVNSGLISIAEFSKTLPMPSYYSTDLPHTCLSPSTTPVSLFQLIREVPDGNGLLLMDKLSTLYTPLPVALPSAPRTLSQAQLYTLNEIYKSRYDLSNFRVKPPSVSNVFAILPVKTSVGNTTGSLLVEFSGSLQDSHRMYFGPVHLERMAVTLYDDKGNVVNLNGCDWCVTLLCECLYQL